MRAISLLAAVLLSAGCAAHLRAAHAEQPNPVKGYTAAGPLPASVPLFIFIRDSMDYTDPRTLPNDPNEQLLQESAQEGSVTIPRFWQLRSAARFVVVAPDLLRFHVSVVQRDERDAKTSGWKVWLEDDTGRRLQPDEREDPKIDHLILPWSIYPAKTYEKKRVIPGWDAFQGRADYVFRAPRLMTPDRKMLALVMKRDDVIMRFEWRFHDESWVEIKNYGRTRVDYETGTLVAPEPDAEVAQTWEESARR
jgi:hypothetical protein